jgi:hypothetical protein
MLALSFRLADSDIFLNPYTGGWLARSHFFLILKDSPRFPDAGVFQTAQIYSRTSKPLRSGFTSTYEQGSRLPSQKSHFCTPSPRAHDP